MWDPEAAGNAAKYLRMSEMELLTIRSAPFDGKTSVWVPYADTGYCMGHKMGTKPDPKNTAKITNPDMIEVRRAPDDKGQGRPEFNNSEFLRLTLYFHIK